MFPLSGPFEISIEFCYRLTWPNMAAYRDPHGLRLSLFFSCDIVCLTWPWSFECICKPQAALKATPEGGAINNRLRQNRVTWSPPGSTWELRIKAQDKWQIEIRGNNLKAMAFRSNSRPDLVRMRCTFDLNLCSDLVGNKWTSLNELPGVTESAEVRLTLFLKPQVTQRVRHWTPQVLLWLSLS